MKGHNVRLGDVAWIQASIVDPTHQHLAGLPHVSAENIASLTGELIGVQSAAKDGMESGKYLFNAGDVLYSKLRPYLRKAAIPEFAGLCSADIYPLKTDSSRLLPSYLRLLLVSDEFNLYADEASTRSRMPKLNRDQLFAYECSLPGLARQRAICDAVADQLVEVGAAKRAVEAQRLEAGLLKKRALESVFAGLENWVPIGTFGKIQSGYAFKSETFKRSGVKLLRNANILPGRVYWDNTVHITYEEAERFPTYKLSAGDVLISLDRPVISSGIKVARVSETDLPALLLQRVGRFILDPRQIEPSYLYAFLQTDFFIAEVSGHEQSLGVPHISPAQVEAIRLPVPDLASQRLLAEKLTGITDSWTAATEALRRQAEDLGVLPQRLLAQVFKD